mmetsp:Transcript_16060/g.51234  ORF Transcript_16060/g.51234 Transcript_16060/m.51234 type:complete len:348 (-) Transcript_16060:251-1294(-)
MSSPRREGRRDARRGSGQLRGRSAGVSGRPRAALLRTAPRGGRRASPLRDRAAQTAPQRLRPRVAGGACRAKARPGERGYRRCQMLSRPRAPGTAAPGRAWPQTYQGRAAAACRGRRADRKRAGAPTEPRDAKAGAQSPTAWRRLKRLLWTPTLPPCAAAPGRRPTSVWRAKCGPPRAPAAREAARASHVNQCANGSAAGSIWPALLGAVAAVDSSPVWPQGARGERPGNSRTHLCEEECSAEQPRLRRHCCRRRDGLAAAGTARGSSAVGGRGCASRCRRQWRLPGLAQAVPRRADRDGAGVPAVAVPGHVPPVEADPGCRPGWRVHRDDGLHAPRRLGRRPTRRP